MCVGSLLNYAELPIWSKTHHFDALIVGNLTVTLSTEGLSESFLAIHLMGEEQTLWQCLTVEGCQPGPCRQSLLSFLLGSSLAAVQPLHHSCPPSTEGWSFQRAADKFLQSGVSVCRTYFIITYSESLWDQSIERSDQCPGTGKMTAKLQQEYLNYLPFFSQ